MEEERVNDNFVLPELVIGRILYFLGSKDRRTCALLCKFWYGATRESAPRSSVATVHFIGGLEDLAAKNVGLFCPNVTELRLRGILVDEDLLERVQLLVNRCKKLRGIAFFQCLSSFVSFQI